jgi:hypothetical protein
LVPTQKDVESKRTDGVYKISKNRERKKEKIERPQQHHQKKPSKYGGVEKKKKKRSENRRRQLRGDYRIPKSICIQRTTNTKFSCFLL